MGQLPVQHAHQAIRTDHQVAVAKVPVHQRQMRRVRRAMGGQPAQRQGKHRVRPVDGGVGALQLRQPDGAGRRAQGLRQPGRVDPVDQGQGLAAVPGQHLAGMGEFGVPQDLAGDGLPLQPVHDEAGAAAILRGQDVEHRGHAGPHLGGQPEQDRLGLEAGGQVGLPVVGLAPQDQGTGPPGGVEGKRPGLLACPAGQATQAVELPATVRAGSMKKAPPQGRQRLCQCGMGRRLGHVSRSRAATSAGPCGWRRRGGHPRR